MESNSFWRRLLHRWFFEYNPLYLSSAALVLIGVTLLSRGMSDNTATWQLLSAAIAEIYAWALIGGAALLTRRGLRRPGVLLALLAVFYQCDLTLHTETCVYLGGTGTVAAGVWLASFVAKLHVLAWALRLRASASAVAVPALGAVGLVLVPRTVGVLDAHGVSTLIGLWLFALFASALWTRRTVTSTVALDGWGRTVLRRSLRATWLIWALLAVVHALFWCGELGLDRTLWVPIALLLATRWARSELAVWALAAAALALVAVAQPSGFAPAALMAAVVLALRALRQPTWPAPDAAARPSEPYRAAPPPVVERPVVRFVRAEAGAMARLFTGAFTALYLAAWTASWSAGPWPPHVAALDAMFIAVLAFVSWRLRVRVAALPIFATSFHFAVRAGLVSAPNTRLEWGLASVALGFGLLVVPVIASWRLAATSRR